MLIAFSFQPSTKEKEINLDPSWGELWTRLRRITPYLWPSKSRGLQVIAVRTVASACALPNR